LHTLPDYAHVGRRAAHGWAERASADRRPDTGGARTEEGAWRPPGEPDQPARSTSQTRGGKPSDSGRLRANVLPIVRQIQATGATTFRAIAMALNDRGVRTARGGAWHDSTVRNLLARSG
jgi:recombinase